jgi:hypothetical protein
MQRGTIRKSNREVPELYPKEEIFCKRGEEGDFGGEDIRGADDKPIYPGRTVRRLEYRSSTMGIKVPTSYGKVTRIYRQGGCKNPDTGCDIIVETDNGHYYYADQCVRSSAGEAEEVEHRRLLRRNQEAKEKSS